MHDTMQWKVEQRGHEVQPVLVISRAASQTTPSSTKCTRETLALFYTPSSALYIGYVKKPVAVLNKKS